MKVGDKGVIVNSKHKWNNGKVVEITSISRNKITGNVILHVDAFKIPGKFDRYILGLENFMSLPKITHKEDNMEICKVCKKVYNVKQAERKRTYCAVWCQGSFCSPECYTKYMKSMKSLMWKQEKQKKTEYPDKYFLRTLVDGKIVEEPLVGHVFDIVFRTKKGDIKAGIKDDMLTIHTEREMVVHPVAANSVMLETVDPDGTG